MRDRSTTGVEGGGGVGGGGNARVNKKEKRMTTSEKPTERETESARKTQRRLASLYRSLTTSPSRVTERGARARTGSTCPRSTVPICATYVSPFLSRFIGEINENSRQRFQRNAEGTPPAGAGERARGAGRASARGGAGRTGERAEAERSPRDVTSGTERRAAIGRASRCFLFQ